MKPADLAEFLSVVLIFCWVLWANRRKDGR
jgi:hypothetical protein